MKKGAIITIVLTLLLAGGGLGAFFGGQIYFSSKVNEAEINLTSIELMEFQNNQFIFHAILSLSTDVPLNVSVELRDISISYNNKEIGPVTISNPIISTNQSQISFTGTVTISNPSIYQDLASDLLSDSSVDVSLKGSVDFSAIVYTITASFDKLVTLTGFNGLAPELSNLHVTGGNSTDLFVDCDISWKNPTDLEINLKNLQINIYYKNTKIGDYIFGIITISPGIHEVHISLTVDATSSSLMSDFVQEKSIEFEYGLVPDLGIENQTNLGEIYRDSITLAGLDQLPLIINNMHLVNYTDSAIEIELDLNYTNPSAVTVQMSSLTIDITYNDHIVGNISVENLVLNPGDNNLRINATLIPAGTTLLDDYINLDTLTFWLNGYANIIKDENESVFLFSKKFELEGFKGLPLSITAFDLINLTKTEMGVKVDVLVNNEALLEASIPELGINVEYKGFLVASEVYHDVELTKGANLYSFNVDLNLTEINLVNEFIFETELIFEITVQARYGVANILQEIYKNYTVIGMGGLNLEIKKLEVNDAADDFLNFTIETSFNNPSEFEFSNMNLYIDIYYNNILVSNQNLQINLTTSENTYIVWLIIDDPAVIDEILDLYLHTEQIPFDYNITVSLFDSNITFSGKYNVTGLGTMEVSIIDFTVSEATNSYIDFIVQTNVTLATGISVNPHNISADVFYNSSFIGTAFISQPNLTAGENVLDLVLRISGNSSDVEEFMSNYINGNNSLFKINISIMVYNLKITDSMNFTLYGIDEDLLTISVTSISVTITAGFPDPSYSYTVNLALIFTNPMGFEINITNFVGTIDFDDIDGCSTPISYSPYMNYILDNPNLDWSGSPIEISEHSSTTKSYQFTGNDVETTVRLNDDYNLDNNLLLDIIGDLTIQIGLYDFTVPIELLDVHVD
ncbi:MAG: DUF3712 domain-containing protein [Candidatus Lokiarchaeota archaeon]|nr:DUF3712 domain-containing protein [Candidatus Harpocratesius repetitus]